MLSLVSMFVCALVCGVHILVDVFTLGIPVDRVLRSNVICGITKGLLIQHDGFLVLFCCKHYREKIITLLPAGNMTPLGGKVAFVRHAIQ